MRVLFLAAAFLCLFAQEASAREPVRKTMTHGGVEREYYIYVPATLSAEKRAPVLMVLYGGGARAVGASRNKVFRKLADQSGVILVFPNGQNNNWNVSPLMQKAVSWKKLGDDFGFIGALLDRLARKYGIDGRRVFATGISAGGMMSFRLACDMPERIAGIAPIAANLPADLAETCRPKKPVSVIVMNGTKDPLMPYAGGKMGGTGKDNLPVLSAEESARHFAAQARCRRQPRTAALEDINKRDGSRATVTAYEKCKKGADVALYTIEGGGHTWSGSPTGLFEAFNPLGRTNKDIVG